MHIVNAIISDTAITIERGFALDSWVHLDYGGSGQGFGGYVLGGTPGTKAGDHTGGNYAAEWLIGVMRAAGVESWSSLKGKAVRVKLSEPGLAGSIVAIGHIIKDDLWFCPKEAFERLSAKAEGAP